MKIISWNLLHRAGATLDEIVYLIESINPDLVLMQESTERIDGLTGKVGGHYSRTPLPGHRHGLAVWSREAFRCPPSAVTLQRGLVFNRISQIIDCGDFSVANVHLSHSPLLCRKQLRQVVAALPRCAAIIGDCNLLGPSFLPGFRDVGPRGPTHFAAGVLPVRIDRCFVRGLDGAEVQILPIGSSDHRPILVKLSIPEETLPKAGKVAGVRRKLGGLVTAWRDRRKRPHPSPLRG